MKKIALITGAYQGIGWADAKLLGQKGYAVILADVQNCSARAAQLQAQGIEASSLYLDLSNSASFPAVVSFIKQKYNKIDVLINNAAILIDMGKQPSKISEDKLRHVLYR